MDRSLIPVCYYPTTILFIDDDRNYLDSLIRRLEVNKFSPKLCSNPAEALSLLQAYHYMPFTHRCITRPEEDYIDHRNIDINIRKIWREIYNPKRFDEITVVVVDYAMPGMNGLDLARECRKLKNNHFKVLMLTGEADENMAIEAFNAGIIDKFIRKDASNFKEMLNSAINELQRNYFLELSQIIIDSLTKDPDHPMVTWLDEPVFFKLFSEVIKKHEFVEYYLTDAFGSYMFLDIEGNPNWLVVKAAEEMEAAFQAADGVMGLPADVLKGMQGYKNVLYIHEKGGLSDHAEEIQVSLHPATKLAGNRGVYYYSFINNPQAYAIDKKLALPYKNYREQLFNNQI